MAFTPFVGTDEFNMANFNKAFNQLNDSKVDFTSSQSLTANQMAQARGNINAAPGGFGLGGLVATIPANANLNDYIRTGFFGDRNTSVISTWINTPANWPANEVILEVYGLENYAIQRLSSVTTKVSAQRSLLNNVWAEWEWINPPMYLGTEYRTTERYLGKPVYVKLVDCGMLPNSTKKRIAVSDDTTINIIQIIGTSDTNGIWPTANWGSNLAESWASNGIVSAWSQNNDIIISCGGDRSMIPVKAIVKYYKTTD